MEMNIAFWFAAYSTIQAARKDNEEANGERAVNEASTVAGQMGIDHEIILANDGSADRTGEVARELALRIPNLRIVERYPKPRQNLWATMLNESFISSSTLIVPHLIE
jgi:cellulose synthase/poly-beta-1,6-N-acetylglucosamine synthase-like glycosyltransferase